MQRKNWHQTNIVLRTETGGEAGRLVGTVCSSWAQPSKHRGIIPPICRRSGSPVTLRTGPTAAPGPASEILPDLGPDSKPNEKQNYDLPKEARMSGKQIHVHSRKHRPRTHNEIYLPWSGYYCIWKFQHGSECPQRKSL